VCIYDVAERIMLRRFQTTSNRSLDGVLDTLNSRNMTDAGPLQLIDHEDKVGRCAREGRWGGALGRPCCPVPQALVGGNLFSNYVSKGT
jgi:periodic tryptophan protein 2